MPVINPSKGTDPNKFLPIKYPFARQNWKDGNKNHWIPEDVVMQNDVEQWKSPTALSPLERRLIMWNLGFFSTAESLTANNIVLGIYKHVTDPACRQYLLRQAYEEGLHTDAFVYICDTLSLDPDEIYTMYQNIPSIKEKDDFVVEITKTILSDSFKIRTESFSTQLGDRTYLGNGNTHFLGTGSSFVNNSNDIRAFLKDLIGYYVIMEGIFFYAGFAMMLALKRQQKMIGIGEEFEYVLRDESVHLGFGNELISTIRNENPDAWTPEFEAEIRGLIARSVELEAKYVHDACPDAFLGINPEQFVQYVRHIADRRLERLGMERLYGDPNPFPWMSQATDLDKKKNFFETRVTEYQTGGLDW